MDRMRELFALYCKPSHNHGAMHRVATSTSEREVFVFLLGIVKNQRALRIAVSRRLQPRRLAPVEVNGVHARAFRSGPQIHRQPPRCAPSCDVDVRAQAFRFAPREGREPARIAHSSAMTSPATATCTSGRTLIARVSFSLCIANPATATAPCIE